jgi:hypothetical protein
MESPRRSPSRGPLLFACGCVVLGMLTVICGAAGLMLFGARAVTEPEVAPFEPPTVAPYGAQALLGRSQCAFVANATVPGFPAYRDRGPLTVTEDASDLVFTGTTEQTGDSCRMRATWDGTAAQLHPDQTCRGDFADGTTFAGSARGAARRVGHELVIDVNGSVSGRRGFIPYFGTYTGHWRCTRAP